MNYLHGLGECPSKKKILLVVFCLLRNRLLCLTEWLALRVTRVSLGQWAAMASLLAGITSGFSLICVRVVCLLRIEHVGK